jgi:hypothetical protein
MWRASRRRRTTPIWISEGGRPGRHGRTVFNLLAAAGNSLRQGICRYPVPAFMSFFYSGQRLGGLSGRSPAQRAGKSAGPNSQFPQPSKKSRDRIAAPLCVSDNGAVCHAIAAIFAAFKPAGSAMTMTDPDPGRLIENGGLRSFGPSFEDRSSGRRDQGL